MKYSKIGFVIADDSEFAPVEKYCTSVGGKAYMLHGKKYCEFEQFGKQFIAICCGTGKVNAAMACTELLIKYAPDCVINFGLSGAINGVHRHEVVLGKTFIEHDFDLTPLGYKLGEKPGQVYIYVGDGVLNEHLGGGNTKLCNFVTGDCFVTSKELCDRLIYEFDANCCDMETAAMASVCFNFGVPFSSLRYLSDGADENAKESYREVNDLQEDTLLKIVLEGVKSL